MRSFWKARKIVSGVGVGVAAPRRSAVHRFAAIWCHTSAAVRSVDGQSIREVRQGRQGGRAIGVSEIPPPYFCAVSD